jgi:hypothetical protein
MARDHRRLDEILVEIDSPQTVGERQHGGHALGDDLARQDADRLRRGPLAARDEVGGGDAARLDAVKIAVRMM